MSFLSNLFKSRLCARYLIAVILLIIAIITLCSLLTYNYADHTWFYQSTISTSYRNFFGIWGAYSAALLVFLFGFSAFLIIPILLLFAYALLSHISLREEWDRMLSWLLSPVIFATLNACLNFEIISSAIPGGYVGRFFARYLLYFIELPLAIVILNIILIICIIIITRGSLIYWFISLSNYLPALHIYKLSCIMLDSTKKYYQLSISKISNLCGRKVTSALNIEEIIYQELKEFDNQNVDELLHFLTPKSTITINDHQSFDPIVSEEVLTHDVSATLPHALYQLPEKKLFENSASHETFHNYQSSKDLARIVEQKLQHFGIDGKVVAIRTGPVITLLEYEPAIDTKLSKIMSLEDDLALALQALSIRIIAPIPGTSVVGLEIANKQRFPVLFSQIVQSIPFAHTQALLPLALGYDIVGNPVIVDLATMPHLLVAGSTGSGKSVALNAMLASLLFHLAPEKLKLILIDPKRLEFAAYADIAHLLFPIITDPKSVSPILKWVVQTMQERYNLMALHNVRNIVDYQTLALQDSLDPMPYLVIIIDELADLMMCAGREIEDLMARITQMARAAGIHMIVATQRPSVDVITGLIKVNFPSRIAFKVISKVDSRTILDTVGADKLLGKGDMLLLDSGNAIRRVHGAYITDDEIKKLVRHIHAQCSVSYLDIKEELSAIEHETDQIDEALIQDVIEFLKTVDEISISLLQRKFRIGYNRSARIIEALEARGLILSNQGGKTRKVIR